MLTDHVTTKTEQPERCILSAVPVVSLRLLSVDDAELCARLDNALYDLNALNLERAAVCLRLLAESEAAG